MTDGYVPGYGPERAAVMIVGEAPGRVEVAMGRPFVGPAGNTLRGAMLEAGLNPDDCFFTNLARYEPPGDQIRQWFTQGIPTHPHLISGLLELHDEIERVNPNVIVTCGAFPTAMLCGVLEWGHMKDQWGHKYESFKGIGEWRGCILEATSIAPGRKVVPTWHPSYIQRGQWREFPWLVFDLERAREQSHYPEIRRPAIERLIDPDGADRLLVEERLLRTGDRITLDIEYGRHSKRLYCIGLTTSSDWAATIPMRDQRDIEWLKRILLSGRPLCAQNSIFDCAILEYHYDIPCIQYLAHDTMIAAHAIDIEFQKDLGFLCRQYTEQPNYWSKFDNKFWNNLDEHPEWQQDLWLYNNNDTWVTAAIAEAQLAQIDRDPGVRFAFDLEMRLVSTLWEMSKRGTKVDVGRLTEMRTTLDAEIETRQRILDGIAGEAVNVKSNPQVARLMTAMGIPLRKVTPEGNLKVDNITISEIQATEALPDYALAFLATVREVRNRRDLISKFCEIELDDDGRIRCHYDPAKTVTGRLSSRIFFPTGRGANLQNVPRDRRARSVFIPDDGMEMGYADLERAESLVVAHLTGDPEMLRIHRPGFDAHLEGAAVIYERDIAEITAAYLSGDPIAKQQRFMGKTTRHASNYMEGWKKHMDRTNAEAPRTGIWLTAAESKHGLEAIRSRHPGLRLWWDDTATTLKKTRVLRNLLGRKRTFYDISKLPDAIAFVPQSTVADALNIGLLRCAHDPELRRLGFQLLLQVHDAILYQYPIENRFVVNARVRQLLRVEMAVPRTGETFYIPVEIQVGPDWGNVKLWAEDLQEVVA